jgi:hypothetical protein
MSNDEQMHHVPEKNKKEKTEVSELKNTYRDNLRIDAVRDAINGLRAELDAIKVDLTNFVGALLQSGVVELVKDEEGNVIYKINKVVLVDESVQQDAN